MSHHSYGWVCQKAASALEKIGLDKAIESLEKVLHDSNEDEDFCMEAASILGKIGSDKAIKSLEKALNDSSRLVRISATVALGKIGSDKAIESLETALNDSDDNVRLSAVEALGKIGSEKAVESLEKALNDSDGPVRYEAAKALVNIGSDKTINSLSTLLLKRNWQYYNGSFSNILNALETIQDKCQIYQPRIKIMTNSEIFISYAWGGDSETLTNELYNAFQAKGITIIRDKRDLGYKGLIKEFMKRLGQGKCIIVVLSDKYLKSKNCIFELIEIAKNGDFYDRIFPVVLKDAKIYDDLERLDYLQHWEQEKAKLQEKYKTIDLANSLTIMETLNLYDEIRRNIDNLTNILKNMNTLTINLHKESDFEEIITAVENRLKED